MSLKHLTVEEREKLRQESPEEYEKLAADDLPKTPQTMRSVNGISVPITENREVRWVNGRLVQ